MAEQKDNKNNINKQENTTNKQAQEQPLKASARVGKNKSKRKKTTSKTKNAQTKKQTVKEIDNLESKKENNVSEINKKEEKNKSNSQKTKKTTVSSSKNSNENSKNQKSQTKSNSKQTSKNKLQEKKTNTNVTAKKNTQIKETQKENEEQNKKVLEDSKKEIKQKEAELLKKKAQKEAKQKAKLLKEEEKKNIKSEKEKKKEEKQKSKKQEKENKRKQKEKLEKEEAKKLVSLTEEEKKKYVDEKNKRKNKIIKILFIIIILFILLLLFSTIFAFIASTKTTIIKGIKIYGIDVSNLSVNDAKNKIQEKVDIELEPDVEYVYGDEYNVTLHLERISANYDVENTVKDAYLYGRSSNIIINNYQIIFAYLFGREIELDLNYNNEELKYFSKEINHQLPGVVENPSYEIEGAELLIDSGKDGVIVDEEQFLNVTLQAIKNRNASEIKEGKELEKVTIPVKEEKAEKVDIEKIKNEIYKEPKDASFIKEPFQLIPEESGVDLAISIDEAKTILAEEKEEYKLPLKITPPNKTIKDIGMEAFPYEISSFSTRYDSSNRNRTTNLQLASQKINGTVLMPGEEFSYNAVVGKRTIEEGYKEAKVYSNGAVVDGLGGGICQISSTLYNAVLLANLEVTDRRNHSFTTSYVKAGRDATVVYGSQDFKFKNTRTYPIKITAEVTAGVAKMTINGIKEETEYEVRIIPQTTSVIPYKVNTINDPTLPAGKQVVKQAGANGCRTTTYKELVLNGSVVSKTVLSNDTYNAMTRIVRVGTGAAQ